MSEPFETFLKLDAVGQKDALIKVCQFSLQVWGKYCLAHPNISYTDSVVGTSQSLDCGLPKRAFLAVENDSPNTDIRGQYLEPITALQDDDLELSASAEFAYYSIYNLYKKYCLHEDVDALLILKQGMSAYT